MQFVSSTPQPSPQNLEHTRWLAASIAKAIANRDSISHGCFNFLVGGRCESAEFAGVVGALVHYCQQGDTFDRALARFPRVFEERFISGVKSAIAGEKDAVSLEKFLNDYI